MRGYSTQTNQQGIVSILTVLMFSLLIAVLTVSFTKIMTAEQQQTLEDSLSKSAYNAAQAGIEDAKRAITYCNSLSGAAKTACDNQLFDNQCPGFASDRGGNPSVFEQNLGIPTISSSAPVGNIISDAKTAQGYSCVVINKNTTNIASKLYPNTEKSSAMYELKTTAPFDRIHVFWHQSTNDGQATIPDTTGNNYIFSVNGNPRYTAWSSDGSATTNAPAVLRITSITLPPGSFQLSNATLKTWYVYPVTNAPLSSLYGLTDAFDVKNSVPAAGQRQETNCGGLAAFGYSGYLCGVKLGYFDTGSEGSASPAYRYQNSARYLLVQALYRPASFSIVARDHSAASTNIPFDGAQYAIDSTGYAGGAYRRVQARVRLGSPDALSGATLDLGKTLCKSFSVGRVAAVFDNSECDATN